MSVQLFDLGTALGSALGVGTFEGGLILTLILCGMTLSYPIYKRMFTISFPLFIIVISLCVGLTWLNVYVFIIIIAGIASGLAVKFREAIMGRF